MEFCEVGLGIAYIPRFHFPNRVYLNYSFGTVINLGIKTLTFLNHNPQHCITEKYIT